MRLLDRVVLALLTLSLCWVPAARAKGPEKERTHRGAFFVELPAGARRASLRADYEPGARTLTVSVPGRAESPPQVVALPAHSGGPVRSQLLDLVGGEHALVLRFGAPDPYVLVLLAPLAEAAASLDGVVVLKGLMSTASSGGTSLEVAPGADGDRLILSEPGAASAGLCGRAAKHTRALDPVRGRFVRVGVPVLGADERKRAKKLEARADNDESGAEANVYLGPWPSAYETEEFDAPKLTDGRLLASAAPYEVADLSLLAKAGLKSLVVRVKEGQAADASFDLWLLTEHAVFEVDTSSVRGRAQFVVDVPATSAEGCLGLTVGVGSPFVEVYGRVPRQDAQRMEWVGREQVLARPSVVPALARDYAGLAPTGRTHAEELARLAEPGDAEGFWVRQSLDGGEGERARGLARLRSASDGGVGALSRAVGAAEPKDELPLAQLLADTSAPAAVRPIAGRLGQRSAARRLELRKLVWGMASQPEALAEVGRVLEDAKVPRGQKVELLRAVAPAAMKLQAKTRAEVLGLLTTASFREAYVLAAAALQLAPHVPEARAVVLGWLDGSRLDLGLVERAALRTEILEAAKNDQLRAGFLAEQSTALLTDPFVRVRVAAAGYLELVPTPRATEPLLKGLRKDDFPRVREATLGALGSLRDDPKLAPDVEEAMIRALAKDDVPSVRARAARTLDRLPRPGTTAALRRSLDKDDSAQVRAEAARALGLVCDQEALGGLTKAARGLTKGARDEADVRLGLNAVTALARLNPADLDKRLEPLTAESVPGPLRGRVESAIQSGRSGCATASER